MNLNKKITFESLMFYGILSLLVIKLLFSYLNEELAWWTRHFTPNYIKYNPLGMPVNTTEYVEYLLIPLMFIYLTVYFRKVGILLIPIFITFILYILNLFTAFYTSSELLDSLKYALKISTPIYFFCVLVVHTKLTGKSIKNELVIFVAICAFLSVIALLLFNPTFNRGSFRWPVFFSGLHTHNYVLAALFVGVSYMLKNKKWYMYSFMLASFLFLIIGYNVRTVIVFYFLFIVVMLYLTSGFFRYLYAKALLFIPFVLGLALIYLRDFDWNRFSSGRLTMYEEKLDILEDYGFKDYLLGRGWGSDLIKTKEWWWEKKGSHNDFLTYVVENGIPFMIVFTLLLLSLLFLSKRVSMILATLIIGYLLTSLLSNGFAVRPQAAYMFFMVFAYIYSNNKSYITKNE
ncbi:hypothetical protein GCM10011312_00500 [Planktosalinus lacus]|uniref:Uncharacterized protein n=2 Tax=Planktosalinus lacus TaxID=1526573 RepID=A0A8J2Y8E0_9FLAO|nr:hypothetical protein GCM10011312_00500 [Planktosalinus lacus]